jgi:hypothetical protein
VSPGIRLQMLLFRHGSMDAVQPNELAMISLLGDVPS